MTKTIWHITMSLDGFIAGPGDSMDWAFESSEPSAIADEVRRGTGAILAGRRWYDVARAKYDGVTGIYGGAWSGPVFVLTHRPDDAPDDLAVTFLSGGLAEAHAAACAAAGHGHVEIFGANTAQQCLDAGLVDEIVIHLAPLLLGDGVRLYGRPGAERVRLERTELVASGQLTDLRFSVA
ncbi:MAG TPA: dihydrofolate reductase family protein [Thermoleophilaceae bacterium]|nr:dihydrofolate reductase family protein [Thermoleophilaceae bacterium]